MVAFFSVKRILACLVIVYLSCFDSFLTQKKETKGVVLRLMYPPSMTADNRKEHWLFLHYHKTGHDFVRHFSSYFSQHYQTIVVEIPSRFMRQNNMLEFFTQQKKIIETAQIIRIVPGLFTHDWSKVLNPLFPNHVFRTVHMVRDPYEMILSGYRYHSQEVPPEVWLKFQSFDFCDTRGLSDLVLPHLARFKSAVKDSLGNWLKEMQGICRLTRSLFPTEATYYEMLTLIPSVLGKSGNDTENSIQKNSSMFQTDYQLKLSKISGKLKVSAMLLKDEDRKTMFHNYIVDGSNYHYGASDLTRSSQTFEQSLDRYHNSLAFYRHDYRSMPVDLYPAIRIEAFRSLYTDIFSMIVTKLYADPDLVQTLMLDDFPIGDEVRFRETAKKMIHHLCGVPMPCSDCQRLPIEEYVNAVVKGNFIHNASASSSSFVHVTKALLSTTDAKVYKERLNLDPILQNILQLAAEIINTNASLSHK